MPTLSPTRSQTQHQTLSVERRRPRQVALGTGNLAQAGKRIPHQPGLVMNAELLQRGGEECCRPREVIPVRSRRAPQGMAHCRRQNPGRRGPGTRTVPLPSNAAAWSYSPWSSFAIPSRQSAVAMRWESPI